MDERKRERSFQSGGDDPKRFRPEEILGHGDGKVMTRLLVSKDEFSRLIGKGGKKEEEFCTSFMRRPRLDLIK